MIVEIVLFQNCNEDEICHELDDLTIRVLELIEEAVASKIRLEECMKLGSLHLAKARYIMGNSNVSALKLPTEESTDVRALCAVSTTFEKMGNPVFELHKLEPNQKHNRGKEEDEEDEGGVELIGLKELSIQQDSLSANVASDPILWFGVLVPQNLRQAQNAYRQALEMAVEAANIQAELEATRLRRSQLIGQRAIRLRGR